MSDRVWWSDPFRYFQEPVDENVGQRLRRLESPWPGSKAAPVGAPMHEVSGGWGDPGVLHPRQPRHRWRPRRWDAEAIHEWKCWGGGMGTTVPKGGRGRVRHQIFAVQLAGVVGFHGIWAFYFEGLDWTSSPLALVWEVTVVGLLYDFCAKWENRPNNPETMFLSEEYLAVPWRQMTLAGRTLFFFGVEGGCRVATFWNYNNYIYRYEETYGGFQWPNLHRWTHLWFWWSSSLSSLLQYDIWFQCRISQLAQWNFAKDQREPSWGRAAFHLAA